MNTRMVANVLGVILIIVSVVVAIAAVLPLIVWLAASGPGDIIVKCLLWMKVVGSLAVLTFWLGLRRLHRNERQVYRPINPYAQPADDGGGADRDEHR